MGESRADSLHPAEASYLREAAGRMFPAYDFRLSCNDDDLTWVVLEPERATAETPRFTFCRIDPCVMVMIEDRPATRRFCSLPGVEAAVAFALETTRRGARAIDNVHDAPGMAQ